MAFTGDCSGSAKGTGVPPICNPICIHLVTLSNILCGWKWKVTIWSCIHYKMNQINTFLFHILFHIWDCRLPTTTAEIRTSPLMGVPGHGAPVHRSGDGPSAQNPIGSRFTKHLPPRRSAESERNKTFGKIYPRSTFVVEYLFNVERGRFCAGFLAAISDE